MAEKEVAKNTKKRTKKRVRVKSTSSALSMESRAKTDEILQEISEFVKKPTKEIARQKTNSTSRTQPAGQIW